MNYDSYRTVMKVDLLQGSRPSGNWDIPTIYRSNAKPSSLISFDEALLLKEKTGWVHFFTHDVRFARLLKDP